MALAWIFATYAAIALVWAPFFICCCDNGCNLCVTVKDTCASGANLPGATVTFTKGGTTLTGTTDGSGVACATVAAGTWTVSATKAGYIGSSATVSVTCPAGAGRTLNLPMCAAAGTSGWPTTIFVTTNGHTVALTTITGGSFWTVTTTAFGTTGKTLTGATLDPFGNFTCPSVAVPITLSFACTGSCVRLSWSVPLMPGCCYPSSCGFSDGSSFGGVCATTGQGQATITSSALGPISGSGTWDTWNHASLSACAGLTQPISGSFTYSQ